MKQYINTGGNKTTARGIPSKTTSTLHRLKVTSGASNEPVYPPSHIAVTRYYHDISQKS